MSIGFYFETPKVHRTMKGCTELLQILFRRVQAYNSSKVANRDNARASDFIITGSKLYQL